MKMLLIFKKNWSSELFYPLLCKYLSN